MLAGVSKALIIGNWSDSLFALLFISALDLWLRLCRNDWRCLGCHSNSRQVLYGCWQREVNSLNSWFRLAPLAASSDRLLQHFKESAGNDRYMVVEVSRNTERRRHRLQRQFLNKLSLLLSKKSATVPSSIARPTQARKKSTTILKRYRTPKTYPLTS